MRSEANENTNPDEREAAPLLIFGLYVGSLVLIVAILMTGALAAVPVGRSTIVTSHGAGSSSRDDVATPVLVTAGDPVVAAPARSCASDTLE